MNKPFEPTGTEFHDRATGRDMIHVEMPGYELDGWLCYRHPDGQWVTLRKATPADYRTLADHAHSRALYEEEQGGFWEAGHLYEAARRFRALATEGRTP